VTRLPSGWAQTRFDALFDFKGGSQPPKSTFSDVHRPGYVRLLQIRDFESDAKAVFIKDGPRWPKCSVNDIMIGRYGASVGKILTGKAGAYNVALVRTIFDRNLLDASWVRLFLLSDHFQQPLKRISRSAQNGFNKIDLEAIEVPLPPLPEQRQIVAKIGSLSGSSKRARDHLDHISRLMEKYKQAVLAAAFRGELTHKWRAKHPAISTPEASKATTNTDTAGPCLLPRDWQWKSVSQVTEISGGLTKSAKRNEIATQRRYLRVANVYANELRLDDVAVIGCTEREFEKTKLLSGDLLVVEGNGSIDQIGRVAVWNDAISDCVHQNHLIRVRPFKSINPRFALFWLLSPAGREHIEAVASSSSGLHTLSISKVGRLPIPSCSKAEQNEIVRRIETAFNWIDRLANEATSARKLIDHLDQAVLVKAFRGKLVPQDPNDDPASVLLERIRAGHTVEPAKGQGRAGRRPARKG
jgi:type I restriction enzyme S subunit